MNQFQLVLFYLKQAAGAWALSMGVTALAALAVFRLRRKRLRCALYLEDLPPKPPKENRPATPLWSRAAPSADADQPDGAEP